MSKIKVSFLVEDFPPVNPGGIAVWAYYVCKYLAEKPNIDLTVFLKKRKWHYSEEWFADTKFEIVQMRGRNWRKFRYYFVMFATRSFLRNNPKSIVFSSNWELTEPIIKYKNKYQLKVMTAIHGLEVTQHIGNPRYEKRITQTLNSCDLLLPVSNFTMKESFRIKEIDQEKAEVINIGGDSEKYFPNRTKRNETLSKYRVPNDAKVIITLARVVERKGHDIVIKSLPEVIKKHPNTYYIIAGNCSPTRKAILDELSKSLGVFDRVIFAGLVSEQEKIDLYNASDIYIMVSRYDEKKKDSEGFGITYIEASLCGLPVIGSDCGGIPDAVSHRESGLLVPQEDPDSTAKAITELLSDETLYSELSEKGRARALKSFTWKAVAEKYYEKILELNI